MSCCSQSRKLVRTPRAFNVWALRPGPVETKPVSTDNYVEPHDPDPLHLITTPSPTGVSPRTGVSPLVFTGLG